MQRQEMRAPISTVLAFYPTGRPQTKGVALNCPQGTERIPPRLIMTTETEPQTFRGVVCLHCNAPIPVPAIVGSLQSADEGATQGRSQVFNLRCPSCHKEKPYRTREIVDFAGSPEAISPFDPPSPLRWYSPDGLTRAAKA